MHKRKTHKLQEHRTPPKQSKRMILLSVPPPSRPPCSSALDYDCALDTLSRPPTPIPPIPNISQRYPAPPFPTAGTVQLIWSATCQRTRSSVADPATCLRRRPPVKAEVGRGGRRAGDNPPLPSGPRCSAVRGHSLHFLPQLLILDP